MLKLNSKLIDIKNIDSIPSENHSILKISTNEKLPLVLRSNTAYLIKNEMTPYGFKIYLCTQKIFDIYKEDITKLPHLILSEELSYLDNNDIVKIDYIRGKINVLFRASSQQNSILLTERCNNYCLMCSQPPKANDDSWIMDDVEKLIPLIPKDTTEIGFSGGEPTLDFERFIKIINLAKAYLPKTAIHILSNGRTFKDLCNAKKYSEIKHPDIMIGIPLYSDDPILHDYIVQSKGAFDDTLRGIINLKRLKQRVEIRIVLHKQSVKRLRQLAEYIVRNLIFVDHVAVMGLEMIGFTRANLNDLWIDPYEYKDDLSDFISVLDNYKINSSVYNHQLCILNNDVSHRYRKSISDWKNEYVKECLGCTRISECGGFFSSGVKYGYSKHIKAYS